jgi:xylulose-5-phosphate/fructose-6-phosphate phosphoketolase
MKNPLRPEQLRRMDAWWRAANYLSVGQIYLYDNPLLKEPLEISHVKPRLLGHWGTTPGLNFIYVHLNRVIKERDLDMIYITGPGHGGPALVANTWLEGTYSKFYPDVSRDEKGVKRLFKQFSFPRGDPLARRPRGPGLDPRGGRARLRVEPRLRRRLRQPRPRRRMRRGRRRGRDGPSGDRLALEQVPEPGQRRGGAADPPPERLQDRQPLRPREDPEGGAGAALPRLRLRADLRRGSDPRTEPMHQGWPRRATTGRWKRSARSRKRRARRADRVAPPLADDRACGPRRVWTVRRRSTASRRRALGAAPQVPFSSGMASSPWPREAARGVECAATGRRKLYRRARGGCSPKSRSLRRRGTGGWARTRTPTAGWLLHDLRMPDIATTPCTSPATRTVEAEATRGGGERGSWDVPPAQTVIEAERTDASRNSDLRPRRYPPSNRLGAVFEVHQANVGRRDAADRRKAVGPTGASSRC